MLTEADKKNYFERSRPSRAGRVAGYGIAVGKVAGNSCIVHGRKSEDRIFALQTGQQLRLHCAYQACGRFKPVLLRQGIDQRAVQRILEQALPTETDTGGASAGSVGRFSIRISCFCILRTTAE